VKRAPDLPDHHSFRIIVKGGAAAALCIAPVLLRFVLLKSRDGGGLFVDFDDAAAVGLHDHRPVIHDSIPVAGLRVMLGRYLVIRYAIFGQHGADAHVLAEPERRVVLVHDIFAKPRPVLDTQNAADRASQKDARLFAGTCTALSAC
jgi:hypothetical protein